MSGYQRRKEFEIKELIIKKAVHTMESYTRLLSCGGHIESAKTVDTDIDELKKAFEEYFQYGS